MGSRRRLRSAAAPAALLLAAVLLTSCAQAVAGSGGPLWGMPDDAALARFYAQQPDWDTCPDYATTDDDAEAFDNSKFQCTRVEVPVDYADPAGATAQVALMRTRATGDRVGSLLINPGGPGASGMSTLGWMYETLAETPLAERFDLVGFDPRGVGASLPVIDCMNDAEWDADRLDVDVDPSPEGVAAAEAESEEFVARCAERSGGEEFLANVGTREVAKDLDVLRRVLGDEKLTYLGYSYGTLIGSVYAEAFPDNVRAMVLDGAVDPEEGGTDSLVAQYAGFQLAFDAYAADCVTEPDCPLGTDPAQAVTAFQGLVQPLVDTPLPAGDRRLSYPDAITATIQALYAEDLWPELTDALTQAGAGAGDGLMSLADYYYGRTEDGGYDNSTEALIGINCMDTDRVTDRAAVLELNRRVNEAAPFADSGRPAVGALDPCAFWPAEPTTTPHVPRVDGLPPTLVISVTGDPATPYQAGVDLAKSIGGSLISVEGNQHTASLEGNACIDDVVIDYFVDLTVPDGQTDCVL